MSIATSSGARRLLAAAALTGTLVVTPSVIASADTADTAESGGARISASILSRPGVLTPAADPGSPDQQFEPAAQPDTPCDPGDATCDFSPLNPSDPEDFDSPENLDNPDNFNNPDNLNNPANPANPNNHLENQFPGNGLPGPRGFTPGVSG